MKQSILDWFPTLFSRKPPTAEKEKIICISYYDTEKVNNALCETHIVIEIDEPLTDDVTDRIVKLIKEAKQND